MPRIIPTTAAMAFAATVMLAITTNAVSAEEQTSPAYSWEEVKGFSIEKKDELIGWLDRQLGEVDDETGAWLKEAGRDTAAELREQRQAAARYMDELRTASGEQWEAVKGHAIEAVQELKETYRSARDAVR